MRFSVALLLAGCSSTPQVPAPTPYNQIITTDLDLLFVIDNSTNGDMQTVFAANFPKFVQALDAFPTGRPSVHIGVVDSTVDQGVAMAPACPSPDPADNGLLQNTPRVTGCSPPTGRFISDTKDSTGGRTVNYSGTLDAAFSCIAQIGETGCGFNAPLEGMKRALDNTRPENAGFRRDNANLAIMFLADKDDCSVADSALFGLDDSTAGKGTFRCHPLYAYTCDRAISTTMPGVYVNCVTRTGSYLHDPQSYFDFLATLAPPANLFVGAVIGDPSQTVKTGMIGSELILLPSCQATLDGNPTGANNGIRFDDFVTLFRDRGMVRSICQSDYSQALADFGNLLAANVGNTCIAGPIDVTDTDPHNPGIQPACTAALPGGNIPLCTMLDDTTPDPASASPCAWFGAAPQCAGLAVHLVGASPPVAISCKQ